MIIESELQHVSITLAQAIALHKVYQRTTLYAHPDNKTSGSPAYDNQEALTFPQFVKFVNPGSGCIMVPWLGMWLGIEPDGYTHS